MWLDIPDPAEYRRKVREAKDGEFQRFNQYLKDAVNRAQSDSLSVTPLPGISYQIRKEVIDAWNAAGWKVSYNSDQREGDWITISAG